MMEKEFDDDYYFDDEESGYDDCPKCGRSYDEVGRDYQYCKACGWDAENEKWDKPIRPTRQDYESGDADILTGQWY